MSSLPLARFPVLRFARHGMSFLRGAGWCLLAALAMPVTTQAQTFLNEIVDNDIGRIGPTGLAIDTVAGVSYLYAVDNVNGRVLKYNLSTGARVAFWGGVGTGPGELNSPYGIAVDPVSHDLYVAERLNHRVTRFTNTGTFVMTFGGGGTAPGQMSGPIGVAADAAGNVYVVDHNNNRVQKFNVQGTTANFVRAWGSTGAASGQFNAPYGITLDATGVLWVADAGNHRLQRFDTNGNFLSTVGAAGQFNTPTWVSFDAAGDYYVAETNLTPHLGGAVDIQNQRIRKYSAAGAHLTSWGSVGEAGGQFKLPFMIVVDAAGYGYVSDYYNTRIQKFNLHAGLPQTVPQINSVTTVNATAGVPFLYNTFALAHPAATTFAATGLPQGLTMNATSGAITGTAATSGSYNVSVQATNTLGTGSAIVNLTVAPAPGSPIVTSPLTATGSLGAVFRYDTTATNNPTSFSATGLPSPLTINSSTGVISGTANHAGTFAVTITASNSAGSNSFVLTLNINASIEGPTSIVGSGAVAAGGRASFNASVVAGATYQWRHNGSVIAAAGPSHEVINAQMPDAGIYTVTISSGATVTTETFVLGLVVPSSTRVIGAGTEIGANIRHQNGNFYDQVLLQGRSAAVRADPGQVTRISYIDLSDDIVQVEFSGAGYLSITLQGASGPARPSKYNQAVDYWRGHAHITVTGGDDSTHMSVFSVGRGNAVNQTLFPAGMTYDGMADIAVIGVHSASGNFGGIRTANASYNNDQGLTGVYAAGVRPDALFVSEINAFGSAIPVILTGGSPDTRITGGDLFQTNGRAVQISGITRLPFVDGGTSQYNPSAGFNTGLLPAQPIRGRLEENGADVTATVAVNPN